MVTDFRKPSGAPLRAGMNFTLIMSPACSAFGPVRPMPRCASAVAEPSVNTQSFIVPSASLTASVNDPCGFTNCTFSTEPDTSASFFMSYTPASEWCACNDTPAIRSPPKRTQPTVRLFMLQLHKWSSAPAGRLDCQQKNCKSREAPSRRISLGEAAPIAGRMTAYADATGPVVLPEW